MSHVSLGWCARVLVFRPVDEDEGGSSCRHSCTRCAARVDILRVVVLVVVVVVVVVIGGETTCKGDAATGISYGGILEGSG